MTEVLLTPAQPVLAHEPAVYPYESKLAKAIPGGWSRLFRRNMHPQYVENNFSLEDELPLREGPFVELGGPTESGYFHLDGHTLPKRVIVSNINLRGTQLPLDDDYIEFVEGTTDLVLDGTDTGLPKNSLGMVLASHIPRYDLLECSQLEEEQDRHLARANSATREAVQQGKITNTMLEAALRLKMGREVYRVLEPGGLYLTDGNDFELAAHELLGLQMKAYVQVRKDDEETYYQVVLQKPDCASTV